jgi:hypothetical protein
VNTSAYRLIIQTYSNPAGLDARAWTREHLLAAWRESQGGPFLGPLLPSGEIDESRAGPAVVAGYPAFWTTSFAFDSNEQAFYLARQDQVVVMKFFEYPVGNQPAALIEQDVYALLMDTFRFVDAASTPQTGPWAACPNGYLSRLRVGDRAYVSFEPPLANRVRKAPNQTAGVLGSIEPGEEVIILDGPACSGGWTWWKVWAVKDGLTGWTSEGDAKDYWLIPK